MIEIINPSIGTATAILAAFIIQTTHVTVVHLPQILFIGDMSFMGADYFSLIDLMQQYDIKLDKITHLLDCLNSYHNRMPGGPDSIRIMLKCAHLRRLEIQILAHRNRILHLIDGVE